MPKEIFSNPNIIIIDKRKPLIKDFTPRGLSFIKYAKSIGVKVYATKYMKKYLNAFWNVIQNEMICDNIRITNIEDMNEYLKTKIYDIQVNMINMPNLFIYQFIYDKFNEYNKKYSEFIANYKNLIYRIKIFAEKNKITSINELAAKFNDCLCYYRVGTPYKKIIFKNPLKPTEKEIETIRCTHFENEEWFVMSRYVCDYLNDLRDFDEKLGIEWINPIFN